MSPIGQRLLERWDSGPEHDGLTPAMLERAVRLGWVDADELEGRAG